MTDAQWALLSGLLPVAGNTGGRGGRREKWDRRLVLDAIFYLVRGGIAWRGPAGRLPAASGSSQGHCVVVGEVG